MKKFLVFLLVLGLATATQADIVGIDFTVNGDPQPAEITLMPSQSIELDLEIEAGHNMLGYNIEWEIISGRAELIWANVTFPVQYSFAPSKVLTTPTPAPNKVRMSGSNLSPAIEGPAVIMQGLILHCLLEDPTPNEPTILTMTTRATTKVDGVNIAAGTLLHTLIIHQVVPEPATLMLLGLGSLFLLRRKK